MQWKRKQKRKTGAGEAEPPGPVQRGRAGPRRIVIEHLQGNCARGGPQAQPAADYWEEQFKKYEENNKRK